MASYCHALQKWGVLKIWYIFHTLHFSQLKGIVYYYTLKTNKSHMKICTNLIHYLMNHTKFLQMRSSHTIKDEKCLNNYLVTHRDGKVGTMYFYSSYFARDVTAHDTEYQF